MSAPTSPHNKRKQIACKVLLLDDSIQTFFVPSKSVGRALYNQVVQKLQLLEADYFDLEYKDVQGVPCWLDHEKPILRQLPAHSLDFQFVVKFYSPDPGLLEEEYTRYLFALQIKRDLATGAMPCQEHTAVLLASYIVQAMFGDFSEEDMIPGYLRNVRLLPNQNEAIEQKITEHHREHMGQSPGEADINLLETARKVELYGIQMHTAKDHESVALHLAVAHMGVLVFQNLTKINTFSWAKIRKLSFKRKKFHIKLHPEGYGYYKDTVEFYFDSRNECKNFWKKCIEHHGFFRCHSVKRIERSKTRVISRGSSFRYSGRTQKQLIEHVRENFVKRPPFQRSTSMRTVSTGHSAGATPKTGTLNSRDIRTSRYTITSSTSHHAATPSDRSVLADTKPHSSSSNAPDRATLPPSQSRSLHSFRLESELRGESSKRQATHRGEVEPTQRKTSMAETRTGALDDFNCSYYTNKTNEDDVERVRAEAVAGTNSLARAGHDQNANTASFYHDAMSQDSYQLTESRNSLDIDRVAAADSHDSLDFEQHGDTVIGSENGVNGAELMRGLENVKRLQDTGEIDVAAESGPATKRRLGSDNDDHTELEKTEVVLQKNEDIDLRETPLTVDDQHMRSVPRGESYKRKRLLREDAFREDLQSNQDLASSEPIKTLESKLHDTANSTASCEVTERRVEVVVVAEVNSVENKPAGNEYEHRTADETDIDADITISLPVCNLPSTDAQQLCGLMEISDIVIEKQRKPEPVFTCTINRSSDGEKLKVFLTDSLSASDDKECGDVPAVSAETQETTETTVADIKPETIIETKVPLVPVCESGDINTDEEIMYILHKRHLISVGEQTDESFFSGNRYGSLPSSFSRSSRSTLPGRRQKESTSLTREQQRSQMEKIKTNLVSMANSTLNSPNSPSGPRKGFDFVIYNKLPPRDSFSSKDDSVSPPLEKEIASHIRARVERSRKVNETKQDIIDEVLTPAKTDVITSQDNFVATASHSDTVCSPDTVVCPNAVLVPYSDISVHSSNILSPDVPVVSCDSSLLSDSLIPKDENYDGKFVSSSVINEVHMQLETSQSASLASESIVYLAETDQSSNALSIPSTKLDASSNDLPSLLKTSQLPSAENISSESESFQDQKDNLGVGLQTPEIEDEVNRILSEECGIECIETTSNRTGSSTSDITPDTNLDATNILATVETKLLNTESVGIGIWASTSGLAVSQNLATATDNLTSGVSNRNEDTAAMESSFASQAEALVAAVFEAVVSAQQLLVSSVNSSVLNDSSVVVVDDETAKQQIAKKQSKVPPPIKPKTVHLRKSRKSQQVSNSSTDQAAVTLSDAAPLVIESRFSYTATSALTTSSSVILHSITEPIFEVSEFLEQAAAADQLSDEASASTTDTGIAAWSPLTSCQYTEPLRLSQPQSAITHELNELPLGRAVPLHVDTAHVAVEESFEFPPPISDDTGENFDSVELPALHSYTGLSQDELAKQLAELCRRRSSAGSVPPPPPTWSATETDSTAVVGSCKPNSVVEDFAAVRNDTNDAMPATDKIISASTLASIEYIPSDNSDKIMSVFTYTTENLFATEAAKSASNSVTLTKAEGDSAGLDAINSTEIAMHTISFPSVESAEVVYAGSSSARSDSAEVFVCDAESATIDVLPIFDDDNLMTPTASNAVEIAPVVYNVHNPSTISLELQHMNEDHLHPMNDLIKADDTDISAASSRSLNDELEEQLTNRPSCSSWFSPHDQNLDSSPVLNKRGHVIDWLEDQALVNPLPPVGDISDEDDVEKPHLERSLHDVYNDLEAEVRNYPAMSGATASCSQALNIAADASSEDDVFFASGGECSVRRREVISSDDDVAYPLDADLMDAEEILARAAAKNPYAIPIASGYKFPAIQLSISSEDDVEIPHMEKIRERAMDVLEATVDPVYFAHGCTSGSASNDLPETKKGAKYCSANDKQVESASKEYTASISGVSSNDAFLKTSSSHDLETKVPDVENHTTAKSEDDLGICSRGEDLNQVMVFQSASSEFSQRNGCSAILPAETSEISAGSDILHCDQDQTISPLSAVSIDSAVVTAATIVQLVVESLVNIIPVTESLTDLKSDHPFPEEPASLTSCHPLLKEPTSLTLDPSLPGEPTSLTSDHPVTTESGLASCSLQEHAIEGSSPQPNCFRKELGQYFVPDSYLN